MLELGMAVYKYWGHHQGHAPVRKHKSCKKEEKKKKKPPPRALRKRLAEAQDEDRILVPNNWPHCNVLCYKHQQSHRTEIQW